MEELMCFIWQQRIFTSFAVAPNIVLEVIDPGIRNCGYGPDFYNAKLRVGEKEWTGDVDMHVRASDWYCFSHDKDTTFNKMILLVVLRNDERVLRQDGHRMMQLVLPVSDQILEKSRQLLLIKEKSDAILSCSNRLPSVPRKVISDWINTLATERMREKVRRIEGLINQDPESWKEAFYVILCRAFGTGKNSNAFERLGRSLPYRYILRHIDNPIQVNALLFGQAGFLEDELPEVEGIYKEMRREYNYLRTEYNLTPMPSRMWKFDGVHNAAMPPNRLASLAALLYSRKDLFEQVCKAEDLTTLSKVLRAPLYTKEEDVMVFPFDLGEGTTNSLIINAVVPILVAYGKATGNRVLQDRAHNFLITLAPETNSFIFKCQRVGLSADNAYYSQALLQLSRNYCHQRMCLRCQIGQWLMMH